MDKHTNITPRLSIQQHLQSDVSSQLDGLNENFDLLVDNQPRILPRGDVGVVNKGYHYMVLCERAKRMFAFVFYEHPHLLYATDESPHDNGAVVLNYRLYLGVDMVRWQSRLILRLERGYIDKKMKHRIGPVQTSRLVKQIVNEFILAESTCGKTYSPTIDLDSFVRERLNTEHIQSVMKK